MRFFLGTHQPAWLAKAGVELFVSRRRLQPEVGKPRVKLPRAQLPWALDSGGYTELHDYGEWTITEAQYVDMVRRFADEIGNLAWAAPMDHMCEPQVLAKTGLTVDAHQVLVTYTEAGESGVSLRAAGWTIVAERPARKGWDGHSIARPREDRGTGGVARTLWEAS